MNKYSVLMSVYAKERPDYLRMALESVFNQTLFPDEVILVEDGPVTNDLERVIAEFPKLKIVRIEKNTGLSNALNVGLKQCSHDWVARMDTDDICYADRFEKQMNFIDSHPDIDIVGTFAQKIDENGADMNECIKVPVSSDEIQRLIWTCPVNHPTVMYRKSKILSVGAYNPNAGPRQDDYDLWFRCAEKGLRFANIPEPLLYYRFFSDSIRKNNVKVGWHRLRVGLRGCKQLHLPLMAYVGVSVPFIRSLLPYPLNVYFQNLMNRVNPRNRKCTT